MTVSRALVVGWLRNEFAAEQRDGFPRLKRVPDSRVIRFLDHFASLGPVDQSELAAILADWSSYKFTGTPIPTSTVDKFTRATAFPDRLASQVTNHEAVQRLPTMVQHGRADQAIDMSRARKSVEALRELKVPLVFREYDCGHEVAADGVRDLSAFLIEKVANER